MFVSINWIKDYVNLDGINIEKLINSFTLATAEVEDIYYKGKDVCNVVVAQILTVENHPNSKKLHLLTIDTGDGIVNCVCGAPNVEVGMRVAFAKAGGCVPAGPINKAVVAGYESEGMCCSEFELGISDDKSGLMKIESDAPNGTDIKDIYPIDDVIFEVDNKSLTNRPDLWGHYGIAREIAALTERELEPLNLAEIDYNGNESISVSIGRPDLVYRYSCLRMDNIKSQKSPADIRIRLFYCGMRSINLLADLTNYIMLEIGQPTHAFDATKIDNIVVTTPEKPFVFTTLDKTEREIDENTLMIYNGETPVAIAGIIGGLDSEIIDGTESVVLESANFSGISVRKTSSRLGHRTDASARYEKMLDPELTTVAVKRFVQLVKSVDSGAVISSCLTDEYVNHYPQISLEFDKKYVDRYTGIDISNDRIVSTLTSLGFAVELEDDNFKVSVPSWRATKDVTIKADIIEEITRIYGYDNFAIKTTRSPLKPVAVSLIKSEDNEIKDILVKRYSLHEVNSYVWCDGRKFKKLALDVEDNVKVLNIENSENGVLRNSMIPTLLCAAYENKDFADDYGIFEIGRVVNGTDENGKAKEERRLGVVLYDKSGDEKSLYFKAVDIINYISLNILHDKAIYNKISPVHNWQHPRNTSSICISGKEIGWLNAFHPSVLSKLDKHGKAVSFEICLDDLNSVKSKEVSFVEPSSQQVTYYDISLVLTPETKYSDIENCWLALGINELNETKVIDRFERGDMRSVTVRLFFSAHDRTLEMTEVQNWIDKITEKLGEIGVSLRS